MTSKRNFNSLPKYNGKHEEYEDWRFKITTFLSEELEHKELMLLLDKESAVPEEGRALALLQGTDDAIHETHPTREVDKSWINHQLYQVLCLKARRWIW